MKRGKKRQANRSKAGKRQPAKKSRPRNSHRVEARIRGFAAINGVRKRKYTSVSAAARAEGTTVEFIKRELPGTLLPSRPGRRLRVRASDHYRQLVQILDSSGEVSQVIARGSHERELAGRHRAAYLAVLDNKQPTSILRQFRGEKVGGKRLLTNPNRLFELARGGVIDDLLPLYVTPEASV